MDQGNQTAAAAPAINPEKTRIVKEWKHTSPLLGCRFDASGRFVFAGAQDNSVQRWELGTEQKVGLAGHSSWVRGMAADRGGEFLFTGSYDGQMKSWPSVGEPPVAAWTQNAHQGWVRALAVSRCGTWIASAGNDHRVRLWSARDGKFCREFAGHDSHVYNVAFHPEVKQLVSADLKGNVLHWDQESGELIRRLDATVLCKYDPTFKADCGGIRSMAFSPDGRALACAGITDVTNAFAGIGKPVIVLFDWLTGGRKELMRPKEDWTGVMWGVAFHSPGLILGVGGGSSGGSLWFWRLGEPRSFFSFKLPSQTRDLDLHPDGKRLVTAHFDGAVRILDMSV